ncbi:hypothetical protein KP79_PYT23075 [Mizuhopecten yessoensis]|uniref:Uncharacterized protein n=1 Tax=Mizuhopecten yessoensis TaxID=6573 RepID=A0A210PQB9_MIZYE|nr:hypothetical protein KP79_PYT23075 [Mizuhopecten yessoensis]
MTTADFIKKRQHRKFMYAVCYLDNFNELGAPVQVCLDDGGYLVQMSDFASKIDLSGDFWISCPSWSVEFHRPLRQPKSDDCSE